MEASAATASFTKSASGAPTEGARSSPDRGPPPVESVRLDPALRRALRQRASKEGTNQVRCHPGRAA